MRLIVNLASEDYRKTRFTKALLYLFSLLLVGLGSLQVQAYLSFREDHRALEETLKRVEESKRTLEKELAILGVDTSEDGLEAFSEKIDSINEVISHKAFSWTLLLNELESAVPRNISITRLEPKFAGGIVTLAGKARTLRDLTRFIIGLEDSSAFEEVFLKDQETDKEGFVEFTIDFKYRAQGQIT